MSMQPDPAPTAAVLRLEPREVAAWLRQHPDFLLKYPEVLEVLAPPSPHDNSGGRVVDLQRFMLQRLQGEIVRLNDSKAELLASARLNSSTQTRVHKAVLALLEATSFEHLIHTATQDFSELLDVDVVTICVEGHSEPPRLGTAGVQVMPPGAIAALLGERRIMLRAESRDGDSIFGPAASLVRSDALVRLRIGGREMRAPEALLALGARELGKFHAGQGTELLCFLAGVLERCVAAWLDLPPQ